MPVVGPAVRRSRAGRFRAPAACVVLVAVLSGVGVAAGCGAAGTDPRPTSSAPTPSGSPTPSLDPTAAPIPGDGAGLRAFGIANGPAQFSLPLASAPSTVVDQANNVVVVLSAPAPDSVTAYLARTLPAAGFAITDADPGDSTFTFTGHGWTGSVTTAEQSSAILLRPR